MHAIRIQSDKSLTWEAHATPTPAAHEVAIRVAATAVNRADLMQRLGVYPPPPGASEIPGLECAGTISAVGADVTDWQIGDNVCALLAGGGYAETVCVPATHVLPAPANLSLTEAAALPEVFATAWYNLYMLAGLQPHQRVLLHAGASGVGTAAIQICQLFDNPTFVTVGSDAKLAFCEQLGAAGGHNRHTGDFADAVRAWAGKSGVHAILDPVGGGYLEQNLSCLATDGALVTIGLMGGRSGSLDMGRLLIKRLRIIGSTLRSQSLPVKDAIIAGLRSHVWSHFDSGELKPIIEAQYPITEVTQAFDLVASNQTTGKVILTLPE